MAPPIEFLIDSSESIAELAAELNTLLNIELESESDTHYAYRALTLTLDLHELDPSIPQDSDGYRYQITINGIFGDEGQRTKWTQDWAHAIHQSLKSTQKYRLKRMDRR
ncbi:hypothetical protein KFU94_20985 [Chloroflexi bacterium TSY]|nr:hypothetical protein [Chloroflexi bacterium TSY]